MNTMDDDNFAFITIYYNFRSFNTIFLLLLNSWIQKKNGQSKLIIIFFSFLIFFFFFDNFKCNYMHITIFFSV